MNVLEYNRAVRESGLPAPARHICLTLSSLADPSTGIIPARFQPSYKGLAKMTGMGRSTLIRWVRVCEDAEFIKKCAPTVQAAWGDKETNDYLLTLPTGPDSGLVPDRDQSEPAEDEQVTGDQSQNGTSPESGLVPDRDRTSPESGHEVKPSNHNQNPTTSSSAAPPKEAPQEPAEKPKKSRTRKPEPYRDDVEEICTYLADKIEANGSKRPTITNAWRREARLLLDEPRPIAVTVDKVKRAIDWCQPSDAEAAQDADRAFWRPNIMSMPTLREKYDRLRLAATKPKTPGRGNAQQSQGAGWRAPDRSDTSSYYARSKPQD
ncbi:hypothetical protein ACIBTV_26720 [Micromonospora sp. NPDC049366]|uniref:hypothetical protein n=1 Tax=Micromonospora sp. NPDC049366 TaxID=3364271 RepID=UPI00378FD2D3